MSETCWAHRK